MTPHKAQWVAFGAAVVSVVAIPLAMGTWAGREWPLSCGFCPDRPGAALWTRVMSGALIGLASMAIAAALLRWAPRCQSVGGSWPFVLLAVVLLSAGLAQWFEVLTLWLPDPALGQSAGYLTTVTTGLTAVALFQTLPCLWAPRTPSPAGSRDAQGPSVTGEVRAGEPLIPSSGAHLSEGDALAQAEQACRLRDTFLAMVSHELRTPLQSTLYWAELLRRGDASPALVAQASQRLIHNVKVQSRLVADLLDMSRLLTGQLRMEFQPVDAVTAVSNAVEMVQAEAAQRGITVTFEAPAEGIAMVTDPCRLEQVAWNLVSNAVHASPDGSTVDVSLEAAGGRVQLVVQDVGVGIAPHDLPHIFDTFHQGDAKAVRHGGLGLGLTISRNIVQQFGGHITARSDGLGLGACFYVDLPQHPPAHAPS